jgi:hypothetical protein
MALDKMMDFKWGNIDMWRSEEMQLVQVGTLQGVTPTARGPPSPALNAPPRPPRSS